MINKKTIIILVVVFVFIFILSFMFFVSAISREKYYKWIYEKYSDIIELDWLYQFNQKNCSEIKEQNKKIEEINKKINKKWIFYNQKKIDCNLIYKINKDE